MLDPLDPSLVRATGTDAGLQAGGYPGDLVDDGPLARPQVPLVQHNRCELAFSGAIGNSVTQRVTVDNLQPTDWWAIAVSNTASTTVTIYPGGIAAGFGIHLGPGGFVKFPARDHTEIRVVAGATGPSAVDVWVVDGLTIQNFAQFYSAS